MQSVSSVILMLNHGLLKIFGCVLSLSRACDHLCVSVCLSVLVLLEKDGRSKNFEMRMGRGNVVGSLKQFLKCNIDQHVTTFNRFHY